MALKVNTSFYDKQKRAYANQANQTAQQQIADTNAQYDAQLRQAYVNNMQQQRNLNNQLTNAGIRGGATETANLNLSNQYANTRGTINSGRNADVRNIQRDLNNNIFNYNQAVDENKEQYRQARQAEYRQRQYDLKDQQRQHRWDLQAEKRAQNREDNLANLEAKYGKYNDISKLKKLYKTASSPLEKRVINLRIGFLRDRRYNEKHSK